MTSLYEELKKKDLADSTIRQYMRNLVTLNNKQPVTNLNFLKKKDTIDALLVPYAFNTKKNMLITIVSVLTPYKDERGFKKVYTQYYNDMMAMSKAPVSKEKSATQKENWIEWDDVEKAMASLREPKESTSWSDHLKRVILSLYTEIQPRRNQDYLLMYVVPKITDDLPKDKNYYATKQKVFVFNKYKTEKKYGQQTVEVPEGLQKELAHYISVHPKRKEKMFPLLVNEKGEQLTAGNTITRTLNSIFKKRIGASMLRHIFLTSKYGNILKEQEKDSELMGHSLSMQKDYIKE